MELQDFLTRSFEAIISNQITFSFSILLIFVFIISVIKYIISDPKKTQNLVRICPPFLNQIGIIGTFVGIFMGLLEFDVKNINESIPLLLNGLKVAFITSILGMILSLLFRSLAYFQPKLIGHEGATSGDIYHVLTQIKSSISGDEEKSMVSQMQRFRISTGDHLVDLKNSFSEFATTMAQQNSNALIEALEKVMKDFNTKINEQFGDNFKRLNEAVEALLIWQNQYKDHVEKLTDQFERSLSGIAQAKESLKSISNQISVLPKTLYGLKTIIETTHAQTEDLTRHLEAFKDLRHQAGEAFPVIEKRILEMTETFSKAVTNSVTKIENTVKDQGDGLNEMAKTLRSTFEQTIKESNENLARQIDVLDKSMQDEIKRIMEVMGSHLASLSQRFVEDYGPLTEKLRAVVRIGETLSKEKINALA